MSTPKGLALDLNINKGLLNLIGPICITGEVNAAIKNMVQQIVDHAAFDDSLRANGARVSIDIRPLTDAEALQLAQ
jgi:hypothetical protein